MLKGFHDVILLPATTYICYTDYENLPILQKKQNFAGFTKSARPSPVLVDLIKQAENCIFCTICRAFLPNIESLPNIV